MTGELIARLEAAAEGSYVLDCAIHGCDPKPPGGAYAWSGIPLYTTSLDAALTLVPPEWRVYAIQEQYVEPPGEWFAGLDKRREHKESMIGKAPTPALALCIAALKARQTEGPQA